MTEIRKLDPRGVKLAVKMLKEIRSIGYREFSLREYERRQEGQKPGKPQRDIVGECVKKASRDPAVLAGFTALLTDYLMGVLEVGPIDLEVYDDMEGYLRDPADEHRLPGSCAKISCFPGES